VCCPDTGDVIFGIIEEECPVPCCDGSSAASDAECPFCCPGVDGVVLDQSQCLFPGNCSAARDCVDCPLVDANNDPVCQSASCIPCGPECECTCRSPAFPFCCPDGGGLYSPCTDSTVEGAIGIAQGYKTEDGCALNCTCGYVDPDCLVVDETTPPAGCSGNPDCESCRADPSCEWCPALGRCTSQCATGADILCGAAVVETNQPTCYKDCYGNGDCVANPAATCEGNATECAALGDGSCNPDDPEQACPAEICVCYDESYIDQQNPFCAPKEIKNDAEKIGIIVGSVGGAGILLLLVVGGAMLVVGGKAAYDFATSGDHAIAQMQDNPTYHDPGLQQTNLTYEAT